MPPSGPEHSAAGRPQTIGPPMPGGAGSPISGAAADAVIELRGVTFEYDASPVLTDVTLTIRRGD